ncbi:MAG: 30S ribosomal protein S18 [Deltaproteobacteria bacterium]|nr:30S ribosomal protein S18 [Deltaproteobacteria bacterium]
MSYKQSTPSLNDEEPIRGRGRGCRFCLDEAIKIDYKDVSLLRQFVTDRGKLVPRRMTNTCQTHQKAMVTAINRARMIALMPFTVVAQ